MNLHKEKENFREIIESTAGEYNLEEFQVEKDYYVSLLLKRKPGKNTHSSNKGYLLTDSLQRILKQEFFKHDFETNTQEFLSQYVSYNTAAASLRDIIESAILPHKIV
ncbi:hypothetical protein [Alkalicoccus daliensis]|uniref:Uncharacterized protein n=1 Tax=Alkalicoccus daliensis TaxID=745820 RepID=A0A1H0D2J4_9BACI|nr:hypothetical protein [Alkalicoccus daliensis]SDN64349.1 hypothetical protein SAMN04488053_102321 [Alkalicoccus daliensis]